MIFSAGMFYLWWLLVNAFTYYAEIDFFLRYFVPQWKIKSRDALFYIGINCLFTSVALFAQMPVIPLKLLHMVVMYAVMSCIFKEKRLEIIPPVIIIFSLSTFMEGISAVLMRWAAVTITNKHFGLAFQVLLSAVLAVLFIGSLRHIAGWHRAAARHAASSYLYVILLPCTFVVWVVRFGFGLDSKELSAARYPFSGLPLIWALVAVLGAAATFLIILKVFEKIVSRTEQEADQALLHNQLQEQKIYLAEAQAREEQLRSFQHDINNHLFVLAGLLKENKYSDAGGYLEKLQVSSASLRRQILTGNPALDILLREKAGYAEQNNIAVSFCVNLPQDLPVDDMDLCIILSNALDNAIQACMETGIPQPEIGITAKVRRRFLLVEVINTTLLTAAPVPGTGLKNIVRTAEKYQGTTEIRQGDGRFRLSVLLCLGAAGAPPIRRQK